MACILIAETLVQPPFSQIISAIEKNSTLIEFYFYRLKLTIRNANEDHAGRYTCEATKDGITASADFTVEVEMPVKCLHEDGSVFFEGTIYNPQEVSTIVL